MTLLRAGLGLFAERGYASTSVREIVDQAGVTKPVLYYYFKSKEGLFCAILDSAAAMQGRLLAEVLEVPGTVQERLLGLCRRIYEGVMEHQSLFRLIHNLLFGPPQGAPSYDLQVFHKGMAEVIKTIYLEGVARGEVGKEDAEEVAGLVLGLIDFCLHVDFFDLESSDPERPERLLKLAFRGIGGQ
ncbi:MAG: TetR/AcrR family transcriptional regulator [Deltaproteobacteria bacterium]|nr:TetR/AcrR family transcriptional regulator [Deltaproteobacteria bacterium]